MSGWATTPARGPLRVIGMKSKPRCRSTRKAWERFTATGIRPSARRASPTSRRHIQHYLRRRAPDAHPPHPGAFWADSFNLYSMGAVYPPVVANISLTLIADYDKCQASINSTTASTAGAACTPAAT